MSRIVDACCLINLYAAGNMLTLLPALGSEWHVPVLVTTETLYVRKPDPDDASKLVKEAIDLTPALNAGVLRTCDAASEAETALFVELAVALDDGEAMCLAVAQSRGWTLATDDRKAGRIARERSVSVVTTAEIIKSWAEATKQDDAALASVLKAIQDFGNFRPPRTMPLHQWWVDSLARAASK